MFLRKLGKRGAEMVEYAIVLACIAAVGVGFYSSNESKLTGVLDGLFGNVRQVLGLETARYNVAAADQEKYGTYVNSFVSELYSKLSTDPNHPVEDVWIESDGTIKGYKPWDKGYIAFKPPVPLSTFLDGDYAYSPKGNTHLYFDKSGNIVNVDRSKAWDGVSRIYLNDGSCLTYNSSSGTFGSKKDYWQ